jgi:hypothetical protein
LDNEENQPLNNKNFDLDYQKNHLTAAYQNFLGRLTTKYLIADDPSNIKDLEEKLQMIPGNISYYNSEVTCCLAHLGIVCLCIPYIYYITRTKFEVKANHFGLVSSDSGEAPKTEIYGPGYHLLGRYKRLLGIYSFATIGKGHKIENLVVSPVGDLQICVVDQGTIMHFELGGQNIILGPGVHKITDPLTLIKKVSLDSFYIQIGPEKVFSSIYKQRFKLII